MKKVILIEVFDNKTHDKIGEFKHKCYLNNAKELNENIQHIADRSNVTDYYHHSTDITEAEALKTKAVTDKQLEELRDKIISSICDDCYVQHTWDNEDGDDETREVMASNIDMYLKEFFNV